ncbi:hypothetical protein ACOSQ3_003573 [Xanthoceras sorbifolium]
MDEILLQLASMSHNGNMMVDQGRRGADERTHIPMLGVQYPRPALQIQNLPLVEDGLSRTLAQRQTTMQTELLTSVVGVENRPRRVTTNPQQHESNLYARPYAIKKDEEDLEQECVEGIEDDKDIFVGMVQ